MSERPMIFSGAMVRAILDGRKTQTRRIIKPRPWNAEGDCVNIGIAKSASFMRGADGRMYYQFEHPRGGPLTAYVAHHAPGDLLWVRETWWQGDYDFTPDAIRGDPPEPSLFYRADGERRVTWRSPIHMPRWASRITLRVTDVRVQRLQDISEADAVAEGMAGRPNDAVACFSELWESIHGPDAWGANPWVCAITFERIAP